MARAWADVPADGAFSWEELDDAVEASSLPTGPEPSLSQSSPGTASGVDASWTNTSTTLEIELRWFVNGGLVLTVSLPPNTTGNHLSDCNEASPGPDCVTLNNGDEVEADIRYLTSGDGLVGSVTADSPDAARTRAQINADIEMVTALGAPTDRLARKDEVEANAKTEGDFGSRGGPLLYQVV